MNEVGDRDVHRTAVDAHRVLAAQAPFRLERRVEDRVPVVHFLEVVRAHFGLAHRHRGLLLALDRHQRTPAIAGAVAQARRSTASFSWRTYCLLRRIPDAKSTSWASKT